MQRRRRAASLHWKVAVRSTLQSSQLPAHSHLPQAATEPTPEHTLSPMACTAVSAARCAVPRSQTVRIASVQRPAVLRAARLLARAEPAAAAAAASFEDLSIVLENYQRAPPSMVRCCVW